MIMIAMVAMVLMVLLTSGSSFATEDTLKVLIENYGNNAIIQTYHLNQVITEAIIEDFYGEEDISRRTFKKTADLVRKLFKIPGVSRITLSDRYEITLQKGKLFDWKSIRPEVTSVLKNHFRAKKLVIEEKSYK